MAYASPQDVQDRYLNGELSPEELDVVEVRLNDAEAVLKSRIPDLDQKITDGEISEDLVVMIESEMVLRLVRNPGGYSQETDGNYSYSVSSTVASGELDVLPREWAMLGVRGGLYTVSLVPTMPWETSS